MIDLKATIEAMRTAGMDATTILDALACVRFIRAEIPQSPPDIPQSPVESPADKRRAYDRKRKAEARARALVSADVPQENADSPPDKVDSPQEPSSSASPLVPPLSPKPLSPPIIPPSPPPPPDGEPAKSEAEKPPRKGARLPADFVPDETAEALARELKFTRADWNRAQQEFRDYWAGVPGAKGCKLDWQATFRNSIRRYAERKPYGKSTHQTDMAAAFDNLERKIGEHSGPRDGAGGPEPPDDSGLSY